MRLTLCFLIGACILASACKKDLSASGTPPTVTLEFSNVVNSAPFELNTTYTDFDNESYTVTAFKYYISNVSLISLSGAYQHISGIYHLVDASDSASLNLSFSASADSIVAISFMIGVDSATNVSGSQTGDLSPSKGMYLSKSAGYIMARLEGTSPALGTATDVFQYDINGFSGPYNVLRTVTLPLPSGSGQPSTDQVGYTRHLDQCQRQRLVLWPACAQHRHQSVLYDARCTGQRICG